MNSLRPKYLLFLITLLAAFSLSANTLHVPDDYPSIQEAIDLADTGDTVLVAPGVYYEHLQFRGKDITLASHYLTTGDSSYIEQTIIDAERQGIGILLDQAETQATLITGFTIAHGGKDPDDLMPEFSGGIVCKGASPTIRHNQINGAIAVTTVYFGGIVCSESNAIIEHNFIDSLFSGFVQKIGGIVAHKSNLTIRKNHINNITGGYVFQGGANILADSSTLFLSHNLIITSSFDSGVRQGGVMAINSNIELLNNTIAHTVFGLRIEQGSAVTATNNIIYYHHDFWADGASIGLEEDGSTLVANYNNIQDGWPEGNNMDEVPMFVNDTSDFRLQAGSPCIDQGNPNSDNDPDGTRADLGALYFQQTTNVENVQDYPALEIYPNPTSNRLQVRGYFLPTDVIQLYDALGRFQEHFPIGVYGVSMMDVSHLPPGMYWVRAVRDDVIIGQSPVVIY